MTIHKRYKCLRMMRRRHRSADRRTKAELLDEMESVGEMHRESLIRLMHGVLIRGPRGQQRGRAYKPEVDDALRVIYETHDGI